MGAEWVNDMVCLTNSLWAVMGLHWMINEFGPCVEEFDNLTVVPTSINNKEWGESGVGYWMVWWHVGELVFSPQQDNHGHQSTMLTLPAPRQYPLINLHHQPASSPHPWILNHPYPTSAHSGPQLRTKRRIVQRSFQTRPLRNQRRINRNVLATKPVCFLTFFN